MERREERGWSQIRFSGGGNTSPFRERIGNMINCSQCNAAYNCPDGQIFNVILTYSIEILLYYNMETIINVAHV